MPEIDEARKEIEYLRSVNTDLQETLNKLLLLREASLKILSSEREEEAIKNLLAPLKEINKKIQTVNVYLYDKDLDDYLFFWGNKEIDLKPEKEIVEWILHENKPTTIPLTEDLFVTILPMVVGTKKIGIICLDVSQIYEELTPEAIDLMSTLAYNTAAALLNIQLISQVKKNLLFIQNIIDSIVNGIIVIDPYGIVEGLNRNAMFMLNIMPDIWRRKHYKEIFPAELINIVDSMMNELIQAGFVMEQQLPIKLPTGEKIYVAVSLSLMKDEQSSNIGMIILLRDMTATRELERMKKLDKLKSDFVAQVTHELKTPLTSIKAYTEALDDMVEDQQQKEFLKVIDHEADRLIFLINDLLNLSKLEAGQIKLNLSLIKPASIVDEVLHLSKVQSEKHKIILDIKDELPEILLDKEKMKEVIINLLSNAIKYSPDGGNIWVRMNIFENNLMIQVEDQGIGIPKEHLKSIFEPFYRVEDAMTAKVGGTGLGLSIVKGIVESHGGSVWAESEVNKGTKINILLPIRTKISYIEGQMKIDETL